MRVVGDGPSGRSYAKTAIQASVLLVVYTAVTAVLVLREIRAASRYAAEAKSIELKDLTGGSGTVVFRATVDGYFGGNLPSIPGPGHESSAFLRRAFPPGEAHQIVLKGGFAGEIRPPHVLQPVWVAYASEVAFQRIIESNDGERIVELRYFDRVRRVKVVTPEAGLIVELGRPAERLLNGLRSSDPGSGIEVAPVDRVSAAILGGDADRVANHPESRAYIEEDSLSNRWIRITHRAGTGVESVEPLGGSLSFDEAAYLFRQSPATAVTLPNQRQSWGSVLQGCLTVDQFNGFFDPALDPAPRQKLLVQDVPTWNFSSWAYPFFRLEQQDAGQSSLGVVPTTIGFLRCDAWTRRISVARLRWPVRELVPIRGALLYERAFEGSPELEILYSCRVR